MNTAASDNARHPRGIEWFTIFETDASISAKSHAQSAVVMRPSFGARVRR
jgi:hypothetical protein